MCDPGVPGEPGPKGPKWATSLTDEQAHFINSYGVARSWNPISYHLLNGPDKRTAQALIRKAVLTLDPKDNLLHWI